MCRAIARVLPVCRCQHGWEVLVKQASRGMPHTQEVPPPEHLLSKLPRALALVYFLGYLLGSFVRSLMNSGTPGIRFSDRAYHDGQILAGVTRIKIGAGKGKRFDRDRWYLHQSHRKPWSSLIMPAMMWGQGIPLVPWVYWGCNLAGCFCWREQIII